MNITSNQINLIHKVPNTLSELRKELYDRNNYSDIFILVDENTHKHCLPLLTKDIPSLAATTIIKIKSGESKKTIESCEKIWETLVKNNADRKALLVNLGGGLIGDLGGFCASTFMRGIDFINVPTTLLAMVDASVGGKVGINFKHLKNYVGLFSMPKATYTTTSFLKTLPERELLSGFAEIIKHSLIADKKYWETIKSIARINYKNVEPLISRSILIKKEIVKKDPAEKGERKKLNFGHTIGHAIESYSLKNDRKPLLHGEAIAIGMICESYLSYKKKLLNKDELQEITSFIRSKYKHHTFSDKAEKKILQLLKYDKKNGGEKINFTLLNGIGKALIDRTDCDGKLIPEAINYYRFIN